MLKSQKRVGTSIFKSKMMKTTHLKSILFFLLGFLTLTALSGQSLDGKEVHIMNLNSGKVFDIAYYSKSNGGNVQQYQLHGGNNQIFQFIYAGADHYYIRCKDSGLYLDIAGQSDDNQANLQQYRFTGADNQQFRVVPTGSGYYKIKCRHSGKVLDVAGGSKANYANIQQYESHSGGNQYFKFVPAKPKNQ